MEFHNKLAEDNLRFMQFVLRLAFCARTCYNICDYEFFAVYRQFAVWGRTMRKKTATSWKNVLKNLFISAALLLAAFGISMWLDDAFGIREPAGMLFVFTVFLISLLTDNYLYGFLSSLLAVLAVNYAFTFPYFSFNFTITDNLISAVLMIVIAVLTGTLTMKLRKIESEKAESERERLLARLLRAASHDLRTPLSTICTSASLLCDNPSLSEEQRRRFESGIKTDADRLLRVMDNMFSLARACEESTGLHLTPTVPDELIDSVFMKFGKQQTGVKLEAELPEEILVIPMDPLLIEQVLLNLLENAVQRSGEATRLTLRVYKRDAFAVFEVEDNGPCILKNMQVYTPERIGKLRDGADRDMNFRLSACDAIIRAHDGSITAESAPGGGNIFRFTLRLEAADNGQ